jgi:hypothetical protein
MIAISAMNWRVSIAVISDPLSDHATRIGGSSRVAVGREPVRAEEILILERSGEQQLRLGARLLGRQEVADPVSGDDVDDRVGDALGPGEVRAVPDPDAVLLPWNLGKGRHNRPRAERLARQRDLVLERNPQQRRRGHEHHAGVRAAVRELAIRPIHPSPLLDQIDDRLLLAGQQPMDRLTDRSAVFQTPGLAQSLTPAVRADVGEVKHLTRASVRPPIPDSAVDQPQQLELGLGAPARRGPGRKARALPSPVQRQLDRHLLQRLRQPVVLRSEQLQLDILHRRRPTRLR